MPTYDYQCEECSERFDQRCSFDDLARVRCPRCEGEARRLFSAVPIIFNGSGFYATDSRKNGSPAEKKGEAVASGEKSDRQ